ncbi:hypothetical protein HYPSUDRAFT_208146 [Hypholoma sublateritium FD-334 SS-4]|uniref:Uncharacterized protein n=1 Tax=Hypholoma sublateritium (strain FD-334 SS-4) TaxID=945553 RepID=A0A0D2LW59_HYPSF|nr:hypothetical protein HYPSUDRAFT_208146 [Hypholoma sublateritium FD-334 SS-4]
MTSSDSDETMRSPGASDAGPPDLDDIIAQRETALRVYDDTRAAFAAWAQEHARTTLARLSRAPNRVPRPLPTPNPHAAWPRSEALFLPDSDSSAAEDVIYFDVDEYNPHTGGAHTRVRTASAVQRIVPFNAYPRYTMCAPASRSVPMRGAAVAGVAPYAPFSDDAAFDGRAYLQKFCEFAWQTDMRDPDLQIIEYDTARRLHFQHHLPLDAIDALGIFDTPVRSMIVAMSRRDYLRWPGSQLGTLPMFTLADASPPPTHNTNLYAHLTAFLPSFCANLNCIMPLCRLHAPMPAFVPPTPHLTSAMIRDMEGAPCGVGCYKRVGEEDVEGMCDQAHARHGAVRFGCDLQEVVH